MSDTLSLAASDVAAAAEITPGQELAVAPAVVPVKPSERIPIVESSEHLRFSASC